MREHKYRAWDKKSKLWVNSSWVKVNIGLYYKHPDLIFEQYIGENDKHGNPICEGDICGGMYSWGATIGIITYGLGCFILKYQGDSSFHTAADIDFGQLEILGTINENPELLEGERIIDEDRC